MSDRELLELAAKAAGFKHWFSGIGSTIIGEHGVAKMWNPLTDDGDALRLLHAIYRETSPDHWIRIYDNLWGRTVEDTRRAIVRSAAEIERTMP